VQIYTLVLAWRARGPRQFGTAAAVLQIERELFFLAADLLARLITPHHAQKIFHLRTV